MDDVCLLSLEELASEIGSKRVSPVEATTATLERIARLNPQLNAYITVTAESALASARDAEREIAAGGYRGPLHGVPIAVKDLFATKGVRTTAGSRILGDWVPDHDATVVEKLAAAGAVFLGKLGMHEFAYGGTSDNPHYGTIHNPWNTDYCPAGSSGGSGAATAACLAFATLGSDTGGSIRMPASFCGCVGLMPSFGRASVHGAVPMSWSFDHPGPLTRTVRDAAIVLQATAGHDPKDPATQHVPVPDYLSNIERGPKGLRIGVPKQYFWDDVAPEVAASVRDAIGAMERAGATVREIEFPQALAYAQAWAMITLCETATVHADWYPSRKADYGEDVAGLLEAGQNVPAKLYIQAMRLLEETRRGAADALLDGVDVIAVPTTPVSAPTIATAKTPEGRARFHIFTCVFDFTGQPAIALPCGLTSNEMPISISYVARTWDESSLLWAARAHEVVRGPFLTPPLATN